MKVNFINPVLKSIIDVLSMMAHLDVEAGKPRKKKDDEFVQGRHVTGLMSMTSAEAQASVALSFTEPVILEIANRMMPSVSPTAVDGMVIDLVGELANMVSGSAKTYLEKEKYTFDLSLPTVIVGSDYLIAHKTRAPVIFLPFTTASGDFFVEATYQSA
jgi:chemotaxis protein CheX|tara:strand:+ start:5508 stop:5984 length:477 start_codon:yes stop_codon:yes gene_type:complete